MYKRLLITGFAIILVVSILTGCSDSYDTKNEEASYSETTISGEVNMVAGKASTDNSRGVNESDDNSSDQNLQDMDRKLIKNGTIAIEVKDVDDAYSKVTELIKEVGGYEFSASLTDDETYKRMVITIKMLPEKIDFFKENLKSIVGEGRIKSSNIYSEDITDQYYDSKSRLQSLTVSRDRLIELLKKAEETKDVLEIEREISSRNAEIDSIQGRLNMWDKLVSMATITLYIDQINDPIKNTKTVGFKFNSLSEIWSTIKNGFTSVVNILYTIVVWIIIILIAVSPILIIAFIVFIIIRKRKKNKKDKLIKSQNIL